MGLPAWWTQRRFGLLVHGSVASVPAWAPIGQYSDWYRAHSGAPVRDVLLHPTPLAETVAHHRARWSHIEEPDDFLPFLDFDSFDPEAWTSIARDAGAGYLVMVAKHHDGLCWWDAPGTDRTVLVDGPRRNVLAEVAAACERSELVFGTYYSLLDWADARYPTAEYVTEVVHPQVRDLVERYGSRMLWGDGHWGGGGGLWRSDELITAARAASPDLVVNDRWWSDDADVRTFDYRLPDEITPTPWETRRGLGGSFGYNRAEGPDHLLSPAAIVALLTETVAKGGHLLLSVGPDARGEIPEIHAERLRAAGGWIRRHRDLIDRGRPWIHWGDDDCRYLELDGVLHAIDVSGRGRFADLDSPGGRVEAVVGLDGDPVAFDRTRHGIELRRPPRASQRLPQVYRVDLAPPTDQPVTLFEPVEAAPIELADLLIGARPGSIVQLGDGVYRGPAIIPAGVTVRGLGEHRTRIDTTDQAVVRLGADARIEHCRIDTTTPRIVWLPRVVAVIEGARASIVGCRLGGHVEVGADDARVVSCSGNGVLVREAQRVVVSRCQFRGMSWDWSVEVEGGSGHLIDSCTFDRLLGAIRLGGVVGATVRGNECHTRWWGVLVADTESTTVVGNRFDRVMRSVDVDGGSGAEIAGNSSFGGDSGCLVQGGATDVVVGGNHWEQTRLGLLCFGAGTVRDHDNVCVDLGDPDGAFVEA